MTKVRLSKAERESHAWQKVCAAIEERMAEHRKKTENPLLPETDRIGAAWSIHELKALLKLQEPPKETDAGG